MKCRGLCLTVCPHRQVSPRSEFQNGPQGGSRAGGSWTHGGANLHPPESIRISVVPTADEEQAEGARPHVHDLPNVWRPAVQASTLTCVRIDVEAAMQPSPMADTSSPLLPSVRVFIRCVPPASPCHLSLRLSSPSESRVPCTSILDAAASISLRSSRVSMALTDARFSSR
jgi:hypothetical protein